MQIYTSPSAVNVSRPNILKSSFEEIERSQTSRHKCQTERIIKYLKNRGVGEKELKLTEDILKDVERIFWAVDDTLDREYVRSDYRLFNEVVKFYSFIRLVNRILEGDRRKFWFLKKKPTATEVIKRLESSLHPILEMTLEEKVVRERVKRVKKEDELTEIVVDYLLSRTRYINVYASLAEALCGITVHTKPFLYVRAMEKLGEDIKRMEEDRSGLNTNIALLLAEYLRDRRRTKLVLEDVLDYIYGVIEVSVDDYSRFIIKKAEIEEQRIREILKTL